MAVGNENCYMSLHVHTVRLATGYIVRAQSQRDPGYMSLPKASYPRHGVVQMTGARNGFREPLVKS